MALTPEIDASQGRVLTVSTGAVPIEASQARTIAVYNFPTQNIQVSQSRLLGTYTPHDDIEVSQTRVLAVYKGRAENRHLRAWGFTLDDHDFYVLRLGDSETLVYDLTTKQWSVWNGDRLPVWRAHQGYTWVGQGRATYGQGYSTNIVAGDDNLGILWILDPKQGYDDGSARADPAPFTRIVTGMLPARLRDTYRCAGVYVTMALGDPTQEGAAITLKISDDGGKSYWSAGSIEVIADNYEQEIAWRSLGLMRAPGRVFSLEDDGATARIDGLDMPQ